MSKIKPICCAVRLFSIGVKIDINNALLNAAADGILKRGKGLTSIIVLRLAARREKLLKRWAIRTIEYEECRRNFHLEN